MSSDGAADRVQVGQLSVARSWRDFIEQEALPGTGVAPSRFWEGLEALLSDLAPRNQELLQQRDALQAQLDEWHRQHPGRPDPVAYREMLTNLGYLTPAPAPFRLATRGVDPEVAEIPAPQLVVPITNARYALNAANARWGSLYDALHGTDALPEDGGAERGHGYNPVRGRRVIAYVRTFLDQCFPLAAGSHHDATAYTLVRGALSVALADGSSSGLTDPAQFAGIAGEPAAPTAILLRHHGLHVHLQIDREHLIGRDDPAGIADVQLEAALTSIMDLEDSVACVDAEDKVHAYRHWLGLMRGDLTATVHKGGSTHERRLAPSRHYADAQGKAFALSGRALILVRNVGHLMKDDSVLDARGEPAPEGMLDAMVTALIGMHDLRAEGGPRNSPAGSIYLVKPKMHGPEEVAFANTLFDRVEDALGLRRHTLKMGIMDEERRTSANLASCLYEARTRLVFINTGFLDRTGDEIHTSMEAGPVVGKAAMKHERWIAAYEDNNVDVGLACGLPGRAQIGKGMWAMPDLLAQMLEEKIGHLEAGASTAWVPSPTAATLHTLHYHRVDARARQAQLASREPATLDGLLTLPLADPSAWSDAQRKRELDDNVQSILGYVVRWVHQGVGCSKVPDIDNVGRMEDRATLRIASQLLANWLRHGVLREAEVRDSLQRMAAVVDEQNAGDEAYVPMGAQPELSEAFQAARDLILLGREQPNGYTEPLLHAWRRAFKQRVRDGAGAA